MVFSVQSVPVTFFVATRVKVLVSLGSVITPTWKVAWAVSVLFFAQKVSCRVLMGKRSVSTLGSTAHW